MFQMSNTLDPPGQDLREYVWNGEDHKDNNNKDFKCDRQKVHLVTFKVDQCDFFTAGGAIQQELNASYLGRRVAGAWTATMRHGV